MSAVRLFVGLELPPETAAEVRRWAESALAGQAEVRLLDPEALHVTVAFLGWRPQERVDEIARAALGAAAPVPALPVAGSAWLPPRRPSVLALDLGDPGGACARLQAGVAEALVGIDAFEPERRAFRPHVTVARVRRGARVDRTPPAAPQLDPFRPPALTLFRSHLGPAGARYEAVARAAL